jgi:protein-S-isoprenylcysteine O-methyltransferase Ste14
MRVWRWRNVPVPEPHLGGLALGILLQIIRRWRLLPAVWLGHAIGWPMLVAGVSLICWSVMAAGDVDVDHPDRLLVGGPYSVSRNPMYIAWTLVYAGLTFVLNTAWPIALLPLVLLLMHLTILREEAVLVARFGDGYLGYKRRVRRYL